MAHGVGIKVSKGKSENEALDAHFIVKKYCFAIHCVLKVLVRSQKFSGGTCGSNSPPLTAETGAKVRRMGKKGNRSRRNGDPR